MVRHSRESACVSTSAASPINSFIESEWCRVRCPQVLQ